MALVAIGLSGSFLAIAVTILATINKPRMRYVYIFFGLAILMLVLFWLGWHAIPSPTSANDTARQTTQQSDTAPYWLAGFGTLALALASVYAEIIKPWWNRPKFSVEFENGVPYCRVAKILGSKFNGYYVRIKVINSGRSVAKRCIGKVTQIMDSAGTELPGYDPVALPWIGTDINEAPFRPIDLNNKEYEYLNILYKTDKDPHLAMIWRDKIPRGTSSELSKGEYTLQVTIYGDNVKPFSQKYQLSCGDSDYKDIKMKAI
jgi:hypothetical protein